MTSNHLEYHSRMLHWCNPAGMCSKLGLDICIEWQITGTTISIYFPNSFSIVLSANKGCAIYLSTYLDIYFHRSIYPSSHVSIYPYVHLSSSIHLPSSTYLSHSRYLDAMCYLDAISAQKKKSVYIYPLTIGPCDAFSFYKPKPPIK